MMHGYLPFDANGALLVPFRTWRNTITEQAAAALTEAFSFNIPQRWSVAHLYQAILNGEAHVPQIAFLTTLAGYVHWQLSGEKVLGVGDAAGMFPIDSETGDYSAPMLAAFDSLVAEKRYPWTLRGILPKVLPAGADAGTLTEAGARLLDPSGTLCAGALLAPPEGDAGTGMAATNSVAARTGNVSAGTSVFAMIVLEKALSNHYPEIDMVTTPTGKAVAMVHCNNCTSDLNAWVELLQEASGALGGRTDLNEVYGTLYRKALEGDADCGGVLTCNYFSGEPITRLDEGRPLVVRRPDAKFHAGELHARQPLQRDGHAEARHGHPDREGARLGGYPHGPRRPVQNERRGPAAHGRGAERARLLHGDGRRGRPLGHGAAPGHEGNSRADGGSVGRRNFCAFGK
jgi:sugar (pentulose or hexulose) kinase